VKHAAINNISECLKNLSNEKIANLMLPTLQSAYNDATAQFKSGTASSLCEMA